jgi:hypothetical protein
MTPLPQQNRGPFPRWKRLAIGLTGILLPAAGLARIQYPKNWEEAAAYYAQTTPDNAITRLQAQIDRGEVTLTYDTRRGYLPAVLKALHIPISSQMLVFSKTSVHRAMISPDEPRALYFNDTAYIGWVPRSPVLEVASVDSRLGAVYYVLLQRKMEQPRFVRNVANCLECHAGVISRQVPGHLMRSVFPDAEGEPEQGAPSYQTTDASPLNERWGGWYVTGRHGSQRHMGNRCASRLGEKYVVDREKGANITDLHGLVDTTPYLSRYSDIVALMVLGHQTHLQNLIAKANYQVRMALSEDTVQNSDSGLPTDRRADRVSDEIASACDPLVRALLFVGEAPLTAPVAGVSGFAEQFSAHGLRDRKHRSLRELDLKRRLMRYPCSYTIYSEAFDALPDPAKAYIYRRLWEVLSGRDHSQEFAHLSRADRSAIREILLDTKPAFAVWKARTQTARTLHRRL